MKRHMLKRRPVDPDVMQAVLDVKGPTAELKILWVQLWTYRDRLDQVRGLEQGELTKLLDYSSKRTLRRLLADAHRWRMLSIHAGVRGNASLYVMHRPEHWSAVHQAERHAFFPPKRTAPPALAPGAAAIDDTGAAADRLLGEVSSDEVLNAESEKSTI